MIAIAPATSNEWDSRARLRTLVLLLATALGICLCYAIAAPFLAALAWALALAVLFSPLQRWLEGRFRHPGVAALIAVVTIVVMVVVPATIVGQQLALQAADGAQLIDSGIQSGEWQRSLQSQPHLSAIADRIDQQLDLPGIFKTLREKLSGFAGTIVRGSVHQVVGLGLTFYLLFFFLRDREAALQALRSLSPLPPADMDRLLSRVGDTIYATIYGTIPVSMVQGLLGGLMFWWLGLPAPFLWGVVMALLAIVPVLGAFVVWIPAAVFLTLEGHWGKALILTVWGMLVVGTLDNLLRPVLVGRRLQLHTVLAFLSVVGGILLFGTAGLIIGPVALTTTLVLLETWSHRSTDGVTIPIESSSA